MKWRNVPSGHWVGMLTLMMGFCLSVAGVVSPWWRMVEESQCSTFEGLWQQCSRCWHSRTHCRFSERHTGLWRGVQGLHLLSLVCMSAALLCAIACADKRRCTRGKCPTPALVAFVGGLAGLMASLMFVGYTERYVQHLPAQHAYAWSFAMSVAGSLLSVLASLIFSLAKALCLPRYRSQSVEPYWPYNQCQVGLDPSGYPHYLPYPCVACPVPVVQTTTTTPAELDLALSSRAVEKRKLFEQYRHGRVQALTEEEKTAISGVNAVSPSSSTATLIVEPRSGDILKQTLAVKAAVESSQVIVGPPPYQEIVQDVKEEASKTEHREESSAEDDPKKAAADPAEAETDQTSLPDQSGAPHPGSLVVDLTIELPDNPAEGQSAKEGNLPVFIVEQAFQDSSRAEGTKNTEQ